jgi:hypothetical protein
MDYVSTEIELSELSNKLIEVSRLYYKTRVKYGKVKREIFTLLAPRQSRPEYSKASIDKQLMLLVEETSGEDIGDGVKELFNDLILLEHEYKGLEKILEAYSIRISSLQSLMKWQRDNT